MSPDVPVTKPAWQSKTLWMNLVGAVLVLAWPAAADMVASHPEVVGTVWALLNIALRFITQGKIQIS